VRAASLICAVALLGPAPQEVGRPAGKDPFATVVRPFLERRCIECHGQGSKKGILRLDTLAP